MPVLDLRNRFGTCAWPPETKPQEISSFRLEEFSDWYIRVYCEPFDLDVEICEQWIHRHWGCGWSFIPLNLIKWHVEYWPPSYFLDHVKTWRGGADRFNPDFDYNVFTVDMPDGIHPTSSALNNGYWDYAPLVLETGGGFIDTIGDRVDCEYVLIEGHQRRRYLNALVHRGVELPNQKVFVFTKDTLANICD